MMANFYAWLGYDFSVGVEPAKDENNTIIKVQEKEPQDIVTKLQQLEEKLYSLETHRMEKLEKQISSLNQRKNKQ